MPILSLSHSQATTRRLMLCYGVYSVFTEDKKTFDEAVSTAVAQAMSIGLAKKGQRLVMTAGVPFGTPGSTTTKDFPSIGLAQMAAGKLKNTKIGAGYQYGHMGVHTYGA